MNDWLMVAQNNGGELFVGALVLLWFLLGLVGFVVWIWALISAIKNPLLDSTMRIIWVLVIVFTGIIGAIIYLLVGNKYRSGSGYL